MGYKLFLDDLRDPKNLYPNEEWVIARTIAEFKNIIEEKGTPDEISFDHDLGKIDDEIQEAGEALHWLMYETDHIVTKIRIHTDNFNGSLNLESKVKTWHKILIMDGIISPINCRVIRIAALHINK